MDGGGGRSLRVLKMVIPVRGFGRSPTDIHPGREEKRREEKEKKLKNRERRSDEIGRAHV